MYHHYQGQVGNGKQYGLYDIVKVKITDHKRCNFY